LITRLNLPERIPQVLIWYARYQRLTGVQRTFSAGAGETTTPTSIASRVDGHDAKTGGSDDLEA
jgi:hypothetical protein